MENNNSIFCTWKEITPFSRCNVHVSKISVWVSARGREISHKNLACFCTSIKYLIISLALTLDIEAILADKDWKSTKNSTKVALMWWEIQLSHHIQPDVLLISMYPWINNRPNVERSKKLLKPIEFKLFEVILLVTDFCVLNFIKNNNRVEFL
jgi:hypothetical protein